MAIQQGKVEVEEKRIDERWVESTILGQGKSGHTSNMNIWRQE